MSNLSRTFGFPEEAANMIRMLGDVQRPSTYEQIAVVTGDEDNTFTPGH